jgi:trans-aconitate methyltransferase
MPQWDAGLYLKFSTERTQPSIDLIQRIALAGEAGRRDFDRKVLERYIAAYPRQPDGRVLFPFTRLFFVAYR